MAMAVELAGKWIGVPSSKGELVPARGPKDFGWDPIFQPDDDDQMYAEVAKEEKNKISHHSRAVSLAKSHFAEVGYVLQTDNSRRG
ncbi:OLC1v1001121C1 [Oldenlandia corymbosa var. corymbosa]|uniref:OLC1v1001121C1 n=1 Tax=Oldenlandia corymbosa var. corymbosa TaxID=529605 RepID=A0AAV1D4W0_OLDCO|nr:OLC1v1001121C1 [Oldenlandia corymbosa var. corymbosa]